LLFVFKLSHKINLLMIETNKDELTVFEYLFKFTKKLHPNPIKCQITCNFLEYKK
jgi:hypothetical protein